MLMRVARSSLVALLAVLICTYAVDCSAQNPQQMSECCHSMKCSTNAHHSTSCCKTMAGMRAALGQPSAQIDGSISLVMLGPVQLFRTVRPVDFAGTTSAAQWHAPPESPLSSLLSLRI
jgi:hypothetical protein